MILEKKNAFRKSLSSYIAFLTLLMSYMRETIVSQTLKKKTGIYWLERSDLTPDILTESGYISLAGI